MSRYLAAFSLLGVLALSSAGCAGQVADEDDGLEVNDGTVSQAVSSPDPSGGDTTAKPGDDDGDDKSDCNERDHEKHHHHRHHKFKVLDRLDGTKDHQITIASLPAGLPDRLIARLHQIDTDANGVVSKEEAKAWLHKGHGKGHGDHDGDGDHKPKH